MPELLVRDLPDYVVEALRRRAAEHGRTEQAELRAILEKALTVKEGLDASREPAPRARHTDFWERAVKLREELQGRTFTPSEDLIRRDRDER